jgi:hypothetical protein
MASREMIQGMITCFCDLYGKKQDESLVNSWVQALQKYADQDITRAGSKAMEECTRMPTPADVVGRIDKQEQEVKAEYRLINSTCGLCGYSGLCILEDPYSDTPRCRQCYTGLTIEQHKAKMRDIMRAMEHGKNAAH